MEAPQAVIALAEAEAGVAARPAERLHALDGLRAAAMLLGIVLHGAASLMVAPTPVPWPAHDVSRNVGIDVMLLAIHGFRMQVFFFLAGFFGHLVWRRLGTPGFMRQRGVRIGIPFVAGMLVIVPLLGGIWLWADARSGGTYAQERFRNGTLMETPTAHLWFLQMLLILYLLAMGLAWLGRGRRLDGALARLDAGFDWLMCQPLKPVLLALPTVLLLWGGPRLPEVDEPGLRLLPAARAVAYYGLFFLIGWWLHRRVHLLEVLQRWLPLYFVLAAAAFLVLGGRLQAAQLSPHGVTPLVKATALIAAALYAWALVFALTGLFLRRAGGHRPWVRYLADASYWWYLWHLPIVIVLQVLLAHWPVNAWLKLAMILVGTIALLWPTYQWGVRHTWVGRVLNGPRAATSG